MQMNLKLSLPVDGLVNLKSPSKLIVQAIAMISE